MGLPAGWVWASPLLTLCWGPGDHTAGAGGEPWGWASELGGITDPGQPQACIWFLLLPVAPPVGLLLGATSPPWMPLPSATCLWQDKKVKRVGYWLWWASLPPCLVHGAKCAWRMERRLAGSSVTSACLQFISDEPLIYCTLTAFIFLFSC